MSEDTPPKKKDPNDLTGMFSLPQTDSSAADENADPFAVNTMPPAEHVDSFESIDQLGMMDHPVEKPADPLPESETSAADPFTENWATPASSTDSEPVSAASDPFADTTLNAAEDFSPHLQAPSEPTAAPEPFDALTEIKHYSEQTRGVLQNVPIHSPYHLLMSGRFGPFERDKLLLFITENPIGVASHDLDLQIKGGRVLFPRITEYAGIRLIQELRDSGLQFSLKPSSRDEDEPVEQAPALEFHFDGDRRAPEAQGSPVIVIAPKSTLLSLYVEIDSIQTHQFIKAEMVEVERSELFQDVIERMTESLKQKARLKGGNALTNLEQKIAPLRLPSQYQISVSATILKKND